MKFDFGNDPVFASIAATKAEYRRLGNAGLKVSVPIMGCMAFGDPRWLPWAITEEQAFPLIKAAFDRGLNTWDTADIYSNGQSERILGNAIKKYNMPREKVVLMTKIFMPLGEAEDTVTLMYGDKLSQSKDYVNKGGLSRQAILKAVDASLSRLQTDYIDLLQIHRFDPDTTIEETMEALHDVVKAGKARYIGASSMSAYQFIMMQNVAEKHGWTKFVSMQNHYSLLYREEEREMNAYCKLTGVAILPWSPLCRGHLARPPSANGSTARSDEEIKNPFALLKDVGTSEVDKQIIARVQEIAEKKGWRMAHVALAWVNKRSCSPVVGFGSVGRIDEALDARGKVLTEEEERYLEELYQPRPISGH